MKKLTLGVSICFLALATSVHSIASGSQDGIDTLAYLHFRVAESMAPPCAERFSEYEAQFNKALTQWSTVNREQIERGRRVARKAAEQGKGNMDAEIERRAKEAKQAFPQMSETEVRSRCEAMLQELQVQK